MMQLESPDVRWHQAWLAMADEFEVGHIPGSALGGRTARDLVDPAAFAAWVTERQANERGEDVPDHWVPDSLRWVVEEGEIVGTIHLRHRLNDWLLQEGGHIGYAVRPTARRRGVAREALAQMLAESRARGIERVLLTCDDDNLASARTIEGAGGVLEDVRNGKRRYWITLPSR